VDEQKEPYREYHQLICCGMKLYCHTKADSSHISFEQQVGRLHFDLVHTVWLQV